MKILKCEKPKIGNGVLHDIAVLGNDFIIRLKRGHCIGRKIY